MSGVEWVSRKIRARYSNLRESTGLSEREIRLGLHPQTGQLAVAGIAVPISNSRRAASTAAGTTQRSTTSHEY
jgi:hypothetical protein